MTADALFDMTPIAAPQPPPAGESAGQRLTRKQRERIELGHHPLANLVPGLRLHPEVRDWQTITEFTGPTCGGCAHRRPGRFPKCTRLPDFTDTHSAASDCRAWWPACADHALTPPTTGGTP